MKKIWFIILLSASFQFLLSSVCPDSCHPFITKLDIIEQQMLEASHKNYDSLDYYKRELFYENRTFHQKNITRWMHSLDYKKNIDENIKKLEQLFKQTLSLLGLIIYHQDAQKQAATNNELLSHIEKFISVNYPLSSSKIQDVLFDEKYSVEDDLNIKIDQLYDISIALSEQSMKLQAPSHFDRNWVGYASAAAGLSACAIGCYIYKDAITNLFVGIQTQIAFLKDDKNAVIFDTSIDNHLYEALLEQGDRVPELKKQTAINLVADQLGGYMNERTNTTTIGWIGRYAAGLIFNTKNSAQCDGTVAPSIQSIATDSIQQRQERVVQYDAAIMAQPFDYTDQFVQAWERYALRQILDIKNKTNELYKNNRYYLIGATALVPIILACKNSIFAGKKIYNDRSCKYIKKIIRDLEIALNNSLSKEINFELEGKLYFLTELLKKESKNLKVEESRLLEDDIAQLQSRKLNYARQLHVVQRMYRTYPFLI